MIFQHTLFEPEQRCWRGFRPSGESVGVYWGDWRQLAFEFRESGIRMSVPGLSVYCPHPWSVPNDDIDINNTWMYGFYFCENHFFAQWGRVNNWLSIADQPKRTLFLTLPWASWVHVRHDVLSEPETHPYRYVCDSGAVQNVTATIKSEEREWRWLCKWIPLRRVSRYIDVEFSDEVGDRAGSWKGGCIGCGYDMLPGEQPCDTLRRMERERRFR